MRLIERKSDKRKLCKWSKYVINEANLCTLSTFPETETMIFKADPSNPNADKDLPILLKEDPDVKPDKATEELILENKRGYSGEIIMISKNKINDLFVSLKYLLYFNINTF